MIIIAATYLTSSQKLVLAITNADEPKPIQPRTIEVIKTITTNKANW